VQCKELRTTEGILKAGLEIFEQEPADYVELTLVEKENQLLADLWHIKEEWDN
jgi:dynein heavy chain